MRDADGLVVISRLDEATLTQIAAATGGSYHPLGALGEGLDRVRRLVENSSDTRSAAAVRKLGVDRFYIPIAIALVLLVAESLIGTRRRAEIA
jgi:Ca-activated chloride channel family protein